MLGGTAATLFSGVLLDQFQVAEHIIEGGDVVAAITYERSVGLVGVEVLLMGVNHDVTPTNRLDLYLSQVPVSQALAKNARGSNGINLCLNWAFR